MKKIVFLTGTRADFGKLKSLIEIANKSDKFDVHIFVTGMHLNQKYGSTYDEIVKCGYKNIFLYHNHDDFDPMDIILSKTIIGFSKYIKDIKPCLIVIHGDRVEALAGAIVGSLNNILAAHVEGGEVSGTVDELIRHAVSKLSHIHLVSNPIAKKRLIQMGEDTKSIFIIGSPDIDIMFSKNLPGSPFVNEHYGIKYEKYSFLIFHPVVTEYEKTKDQIRNIVDAVLESKLNYIVIYPNNDKGSTEIFSEYKRLENNPRIKIFPSLRFEYFLALLKNSSFIIGNSSLGIREAPYYGIPTINIGTRQFNRTKNRRIINCGYRKDEIIHAMNQVEKIKYAKQTKEFGTGKSDKKFLKIISSNKFWEISVQKQFNDFI